MDEGKFAGRLVELRLRQPAKLLSGLHDGARNSHEDMQHAQLLQDLEIGLLPNDEPKHGPSSTLVKCLSIFPRCKESSRQVLDKARAASLYILSPYYSTTAKLSVYCTLFMLSQISKTAAHHCTCIGQGSRGALGSISPSHSQGKRSCSHLIPCREEMHQRSPSEVDFLCPATASLCRFLSTRHMPSYGTSGPMVSPRISISFFLAADVTY